MGARGKVPAILEAYDRRLRELADWFGGVRARYGDRMRCGRGCAACCRSLFDVPAPDALRVAAGFARLAPGVSRQVRRRAAPLQAGILRESPPLASPFFLHRLPEAALDRLAGLFDADPCPFLGEGDACLIYDFRPMACILEGVPMVDRTDGPFDDWCGLNFTGGIDRAVAADLGLDYGAIEGALARAGRGLARAFPALPGGEATVWIPSIVAAFDTFWRGFLEDRPPGRPRRLGRC